MTPWCGVKIHRPQSMKLQHFCRVVWLKLSPLITLPMSPTRMSQTRQHQHLRNAGFPKLHRTVALKASCNLYSVHSANKALWRRTLTREPK